MEITVTHQGKVLAQLGITQDGEVHVLQGAPAAAGSVGSAQYVWGATNSRSAGQYQQTVIADGPEAGGASADPAGEKVTSGLIDGR